MSTRSSARSSGSTTTTVTTQRRSTTSSTARPNASTTRRSTTSTRPATTTTRRSTTTTRPSTTTRTTTTAAAKRKPSTTTKKSQVANDAALARAMAKADQEALDADLARVINGLSTSSSNSSRRSNRSSSKNSPPLIFLKPPPPPSHMCFVPCVMGAGAGMERCVEMMVDTGAQSSVISLQLAQKLNLQSKLDDSHQGIAAGVGRAHIVGKLRGVKCQLGQVEFNMDFSVLDVQDELLLLGMDLMRKYKCVVDLEKDVLLFGGRNGVEVPLLPPNQDQIAISNQVRNGCEIQ